MSSARTTQSITHYLRKGMDKHHRSLWGTLGPLWDPVQAAANRVDTGRKSCTWQIAPPASDPEAE
jgi:hypothetical protein